VTASVAGEVEIVVEVEVEVGGLRELCLLALGPRRRQRRNLLEGEHAGRRQGDLRPGLDLADDPEPLGAIEGAGGALDRSGALCLLACEARGEVVGCEGLL
jgi:hypothetical protein